MASHYDDLAKEIWACRWGSIVATKSMGAKERAELKAAIRAQYGEVIDLDAGSSQILEAVLKARDII